MVEWLEFGYENNQNIQIQIQNVFSDNKKKELYDLMVFFSTIKII